VPPTASDLRSRRALELVAELLALDAAALDARLGELARTEPDLHREVVSLLAAVGESQTFLARPLLGALPTRRPLPPRIGPFLVLDTIASGGMGVVVHARRTEPFLQDVAIKLMHGTLPAGERARFADERRHLARIEHPNVARIIDGGELADGHPYLAQEYVRGEPIDDYCARQELPLEPRLGLFLGVLAGVEAVHAAGVIHCDLKPDNILVDATGRPRIVDFGISQLAGSAQPLSRYTGEFASPEIAAGKPPSEQSDVYALGRTLGQLAAGADLTRRVPRPSLGARLAAAWPIALLRRADLRRVVALACAPSLDDRLRTVGELRTSIEALLARQPIASPRRGRRAGILRMPRTLPAFAAAAAAVLLAVGALGWLVAERRFARRERAVLAEATRRCAVLLAATDRIARLPLAAAESESAAQAERIRALARWADSAAGASVAGAAGARGCAAYASFDFRRASAALAAAAGAPSATPLSQQLWARSLWYRGRLDTDNLRRLIAGTELGSGRIASVGRLRRENIGRAFEASMAAFASSRWIDSSMLAVSHARLGEALRVARQSAEENPTSFESRRVEAEAAFAIAVADTGPADSSSRFAAMRAALDAGMAIAPADPWLWLAQCRMRGAILESRNRRREGPAAADDAERAAAPCRTALRLAPELADAYSVQATIRYDWSWSLVEAGEDPTSEVAKLSAVVDTLLARRPDEATALLVRGNAANLQVYWLLSHGRDPTALLATAQRDLAQALRLSGNASRALNALGNTWSLRGTWSTYRGGEATAALHAAVQQYEAALGRAPATPLYLINLGLAQLALAGDEARFGRDPERPAAAAVAAFDSALEISPNSQRALAERSASRLLLLEQRVVRGEGTEELAARIAADLDRLAALNPKAGSLPELRAQSAAVRALHALASGRPAEVLGDPDLRPAPGDRPPAPWDRSDRHWVATLHLVRATAAAGLRRSPEQELSLALRELAPVPAAAPDPAIAPTLRAKALWQLAVWRQRSGAGAGDLRERARREIEAARRANAALPRAQLWEGLVASLAAEAADDDRQRARAGSLMRLAVASNPDLPRREMLGGFWCEAAGRPYWPASLCAEDAAPGGRSANARKSQARAAAQSR
jgi:Protein kinase domain